MTSTSDSPLRIPTDSGQGLGLLTAPVPVGAVGVTPGTPTQAPAPESKE